MQEGADDAVISCAKANVTAGAARAAAALAAAPKTKSSGRCDAYSNPSTTYRNPPAGTEASGEPTVIEHHRSDVEQVPIPQV